MRNHRSISKDKLVRGPAQAVVVSGLAAGLVAASLTGIGTASATCIGISGINIGAGCSTTFGNFALGLGPGTQATATGSLATAIATGTGTIATSDGVGTLAYAGGIDSEALALGILNTAIAGFGFEGPFNIGPNVYAQAGVRDGDFGNLAINFGSADDAPRSGGPATSLVGAGNGSFNLAGNFFGNANNGAPLSVLAGGDTEDLGFGAVAANFIANRSEVSAIGTLLNATNWGTPFDFPQASDSTVTAGTPGAPTSLSWAFNYQGLFTGECPADCGNVVSTTGPLTVAGAIDVINQTVIRRFPGINIVSQVNEDSSGNAALAATGSDTNGLAAVGAQRSLFLSKLKAASNGTKFASAGGSNKSASASSFNGGVKKFNDSVKKFNDSVKKFNNDNVKKFNDNVKRVARALGGAKAADK